MLFTGVTADTHYRTTLFRVGLLVRITDTNSHTVSSYEVPAMMTDAGNMYILSIAMSVSRMDVDQHDG